MPSGCPQQVPGDTGDGSRQGHHPWAGPCTEVGTAEEEPPQPRHQAEMGHGELAVGNQNTQTENRDHWERDLHLEQLHRPEKAEQDLRMLH